MEFLVSPVKDGAQDHPSRMAKALRNLQQVAEQCHDIVFITDSAGLITRVNPAFERMIGYSALDAVGKDLSFLTPGGAQSQDYRRIWAHIFAQKAFQGTIAFQTQSGTTRVLEITITPLRDNRGGITNLVGTGRELPALERGQVSGKPASTAAMAIAHELSNVLTISAATADLALVSLTPDHPLWRKLQDIKDAARVAAELGRQLIDAERAQAVLPERQESERQLVHDSARDELQSNQLSGRRPAASCKTDMPPEIPSVLIVEDEALVREAEVEFLGKNGYRVFAASTAEEALQLTKSHAGDIHLVVTDLMLPQKSGLQLARELSGIEPAIKVLLTSGHNEKCVLDDKLPSMTVHFLPKPFSLDTLAVKVGEILKQPEHARAASASA